MSFDVPDTFKGKSFWEKPEGTTGLVILALLTIGGGFAAWWLLPIIITILQNTLYAAGLFAAVAALFSLVTNKRVRTLVSYMFKSVMRKVTGIFTEVDPIGIARNYIQSRKDRIGEMEEQITRLKAQMGILKQQIQQKGAERDQALRTAQRAQATQKGAVLQLQLSKAGRREKSTIALTDLYNKIEAVWRILGKMREAAILKIADLEDEVDERQTLYTTMKTAHGAFSTAMKVLNGGETEDELFQRAMEHMITEVGAQVGEIDEFMDVSRNLLEGIDLERGVMEDRGLEMLAAWEKRADSLLSGDTKAAILSKASTPGFVDDNEFDTPLPAADILAEARRQETARNEAARGTFADFWNSSATSAPAADPTDPAETARRQAAAQKAGQKTM